MHTDTTTPPYQRLLNAVHNRKRRLWQTVVRGQDVRGLLGELEGLDADFCVRPYLGGRYRCLSTARPSYGEPVDLSHYTGCQVLVVMLAEGLDGVRLSQAWRELAGQ